MYKIPLPNIYTGRLFTHGAPHKLSASLFLNPHTVFYK